MDKTKIIFFIFLINTYNTFSQIQSIEFDKNIYIFSSSNEISGQIYEFDLNKISFEILCQTNNNMFEKHLANLSDKKLRYVCSGIFSNSSNNVPIGLYIEKGKMVNEYIYNIGFDGLCIVKNCELYIFNINNIFIFNDLTFNLKNTIDKKKFLDYSVNENLTVFQIQLLYFNNSITFTNINNEKSERRFLCLVENSGNLYYIIFYSFIEKSLFEFVNEIINYLMVKKYNTIWIVNLDVGIYNYQKVFDINHNEYKDFSEGYFNEIEDIFSFFYFFEK